jgi:hypothetical protein
LSYDEITVQRKIAQLCLRIDQLIRLFALNNSAMATQMLIYRGVTRNRQHTWLLSLAQIAALEGGLE